MVAFVLEVGSLGNTSVGAPSRQSAQVFHLVLGAFEVGRKVVLPGVLPSSSSSSHLWPSIHPQA